jgi:hypothetical protein
MSTNKIIRANGTQTLKLGDGIEINQSTGTVTVPGDLIVSQNFTVNGTSITINTANLDVEDKNITINKNGNDTSAEGAGLTVERAGTDGSLIYDSTLISKWKLGNVGSESEVIIATGNQSIGGNKIFTGNSQFDGEVDTDAAHRGGYGLVPVGTIVAYNPGYYTNSANAGFAAVGPAGNTVAQVNAFLNAKGWYVCDGAAVNNANSPIWNAAGRNLPNLSDQRFLMGSSSAGGAGGSNANRDISHTHSVTSNVTAAAITLTTANLPVHSHAKGTLASAVSLTGTTTFASASHAHKSGIVRRPDNLWEFESYSTVIVSNTTVTGALISVEGGARMLKGDSTRGLGPVNAYRTDGPSATASVGISNGAITGSTANAGSGTSFTPSLTNNAVTSGAMSANSTFDILPQYLTTYFIIRVF